MSDNTKEIIIDAAAKSFSENGYHQTKMDQIARTASVAKGTIYYNFSSKAVLFAEVVVTGINLLIKKIKKEIEPDMSAEEKLKVLIKCTLDIYLKYNNISSILINELGSGIDKKAIARIDEAKNKYIHFIENIIKEGITKNELKKLKVEATANAVVELIEGSLSYYLKNKDNLSKDFGENQIYPLIKEILFEGIKK